MARLSEVRRALTDAGIADARAEAVTLFSFVTGIPPYRLLGDDPITNDPALDAAVLRRVRHEPLAYITGEVSFFHETYTVTKDVLIPRADTETLVAEAIRFLPRGAHFLDFCTGSGCVAISVLAARPDCTATGYDISPAAIKIACLNAERNGVSARFRCECADLLTARVKTAEVAAILSNPPYITDDEMIALSPEVLSEPHVALEGGADGLRFYRSFLSVYAPTADAGYTSPSFLFEIGYRQREALTAAAAQFGYSARCVRDLGGRDRVVICTPPCIPLRNTFRN